MLYSMAKVSNMDSVQMNIPLQVSIPYVLFCGLLSGFCCLSDIAVFTYSVFCTRSLLFGVISLNTAQATSATMIIAMKMAGSKTALAASSTAVFGKMPSKMPTMNCVMERMNLMNPLLGFAPRSVKTRRSPRMISITPKKTPTMRFALLFSGLTTLVSVCLLIWSMVCTPFSISRLSNPYDDSHQMTDVCVGIFYVKHEEDTFRNLIVYLL